MLSLDRPINILLIEDETYDVNRVMRTLAPFEDKVKIQTVVADGQSAVELLEENSQNYDVIIMDYQIVGPLSGAKLIQKIKLVDPYIQIIVITKMTINITDYDFANKLMEAGAIWFCTKYPSDIKDYIYQPTDFLLSIFNAYEKKKLEMDKSKSKSQLKQSIKSTLGQKQIIGESQAAKKMIRQIEKAAERDATVLIHGASGTGKELVATHIHYLSKRKYENFVTVNSGSIPSDLIESELFGFVKGSFTGAVGAKKGLFEVANNGTLFLDEISELSMSAQVKLLRVLQEGELDKIGRTDKINVDVRVIAATNVDLENAIEDKSFREDLFYRLNVLNVYAPTLRERLEDIPLLTNFFINKFCEQMALPIPEIDNDAIEVFQTYDWPGNIRQLQNIVQRTLVACENRIKKDDVLSVMGSKKLGKVSGPEFWFGEDIVAWKEMEHMFRIKYFSYVKDQAKSDSEAARLLGMAPSNFFRMCSKLGIK